MRIRTTPACSPSSTRRKLCLFPGSFPSETTRLLTPRPLLDLLVCFSELGIYWSQTRSTRDTSPLYVAMMCGVNTEWAYSENVLALPGFNIWTIAAPSSATAVTSGASVVDGDTFLQYFFSICHSFYLTSSSKEKCHTMHTEQLSKSALEGHHVDAANIVQHRELPRWTNFSSITTKCTIQCCRLAIF